MGTRALVVFKDKDDAEIVVIYRQYDGYPEGLGEELKSFLSSKRIVNGFNKTNAEHGDFNGMECLAAQVVAHLKDGIGNVYLHPAGTRDLGEDYIYTITEKDGKAALKIEPAELDPDDEDNYDAMD